MDLYSCTREGSNWSEPKNLGVLINTKGNEVFPYIHSDQTLFFASNGHEGLGGLDIFYSKKKETGFTDVHNIGYPVNTADDDFSLIYDNKNKAGYFSSNRENRDGDDDIFVYTRTLKLTGIVVEKETGQPLADALVELKTSDDQVSRVVTTANGRFEFPADFNQHYFIKGSKEHHGEVSDSVSTATISPAEDPFVRIELSSPSVSTLTIKVFDKETRLPVHQASVKTEKTKTLIGKTTAEGSYKQIMPDDSTMKLIVSKPGYASKLVMVSTKGLSRAKNFVYNVTLKPTEGIEGYEDWYKLVYFDLDKSSIRDDAKKTLDEIIIFLETNPNIIIGLSAHTDSRASREYNIGLSQRRAQSVKEYILSKGVEPGRIARMEWDGESLLVNRCDDGTPCSEDDHQLNRRCEIRVTGKLKHSLSKK
jgi:outer membrane protein OmpA-like peptidoglycan-associated protein/5-hydroxyisourate hydrolase-like protein (transthyretin family)